MKKPLFSCRAALALGVLWLGAATDSGAHDFDIKIGGDADFTAGYTSQSYDSGATQHVDFTNRFRVNITPTATADNGMEYGASLRNRAYTANGTIDAQRAYLFADGRYGRVEAGLVASPNAEYAITTPYNFGTGGVDGDWSNGTGWLQNQNTFLEPYFGGGFNGITDTTWSTRISYFTPRVFGQGEDAPGLMATLSFVPQNLNLGTGVSRVRTIGTTGKSFCAATLPNSPISGCAYKNVVETGLVYDGKLDEVTISATAAYEHGEAPADRTGVAYHALSAYQAGLQLGYAGFHLGGSYVNAGKSSYAANQGYFLNDQTTVAVGISYETGPLVIGFNYAHGEDAGDVTVPGKRTADLYAVGLTYTLAPGLTTALEYLRSITANEPGYGTDPFNNDARGTPPTPADIGYGSGNGNLILWKTVVAF